MTIVVGPFSKGLNVFLGLCLTCVCVGAEIRSAVIDKQTGQLSVVDGYRDDFVAWANFTDDIKTSGWSFLEVTTSSQYNDSIQAYAAGAVEAALTSQLIYKHWMNTLMGYCGPFTSQSDYCKRLKDFITINLQWIQEQIEKQPTSPYWYQVRLALLQLKGLEDSYNDELSLPLGSFSFNPFGFILFQLGGDLEDLESALNKSSQTRPLGSGSCSALIKLLPNNKELLVSHDTWNVYQAMLRIMKKYIFAFKVSPADNDPIPGGTQAFSSYPGTIFSGDDFYILSSGLVTLETTIGNSNPALWKFVQPKGSVLEWLRNIVANRLAATGKEWADLFSKYNSGTYNNQWMIVDYKHFTPGKTDIKEQLFVVLEQIPGLIVYNDKTQELLEKGYWASYNIPYYVDIFNASGCNELVEKFGANMILGIIILKKRYTASKYLSIALVSAGIFICTIMSAKQVNVANEGSEEEGLFAFMHWLIGIAMLTFALLMSARMGIFQETLYKQYGKHSKEALFYNHCLPLPGFLLLSTNIYNHCLHFNQSSPVVVPGVGLTVPIMWIYLLVNVVTQYVCIRGVFILTTECASLTVTLVVTLRKFLSLIFSILYFQNPFTTWHWVGTAVVFLGTLLYTEVWSSVQAALRGPEVKEKKAE